MQCKVTISGGVDSTVCAALLHRALGPERVIAIHIDNGFMRMNESKNVEKVEEAAVIKNVKLEVSGEKDGSSAENNKVKMVTRKKVAKKLVDGNSVQTEEKSIESAVNNASIQAARRSFQRHQTLGSCACFCCARRSQCSSGPAAGRSHLHPH